MNANFPMSSAGNEVLLEGYFESREARYTSGRELREPGQGQPLQSGWKELTPRSFTASLHAHMCLKCCQMVDGVCSSIIVVDGRNLDLSRGDGSHDILPEGSHEPQVFHLGL